MAKNYATATLNITFATVTTETDMILKAELIDNEGRNQFDFGGSPPKFGIFTSPNIKQITIITSDGVVVGDGSGVKEDILENLTWADAADPDGEGGASYQNATVSYPVKEGTERVLDIFGNIGAVSLVEAGKTTFRCSKTSTGPLDPVVGLARVQYNSAYIRKKLTSVAEPYNFGGDFSEYSVVIYIIGSA